VQGIRQVVVLGVKPEKKFERINEEFPVMMQDLHDAYLNKNAPFFKKDKQVLDFQAITELREAKENLPETLTFFSQGERGIIIASCAAPDFEHVEALVHEHNRTARAKNLNYVAIAWATGEVLNTKSSDKCDGAGQAVTAQSEMSSELWRRSSPWTGGCFQFLGWFAKVCCREVSSAFVHLVSHSHHCCCCCCCC